MTNPLSQFLRQSQPQRPATNNPLAMISEFRKFAAGKAKQQIEQLLSSGQMTQEQFQQYQQQAKEFMQFLK